jgi:hypothetical protein
MVLVGVSEFYQLLAQGAVIVTAVALDEAQRRRLARATYVQVEAVTGVSGTDGVQQEAPPPETLAQRVVAEAIGREGGS